MAGMISGFLSSSKLIIRMGDWTFAHATNLSFTDRMAVAPVGGIGGFNPDALEPLQYSAGGTMSITLYTKDSWDAAAASGVPLPERVAIAAESSGWRQGNSLLNRNNFSPAHLLISRSFDIDVYERMAAGAGAAYSPSADEVHTYRLEGCRLTTYSLTFTPGSLLAENVGFMCLRVVDRTIEANKTELA